MPCRAVPRKLITNSAAPSEAACKSAGAEGAGEKKERDGEKRKEKGPRPENSRPRACIRARVPSPPASEISFRCVYDTEDGLGVATPACPPLPLTTALRGVLPRGAGTSMNNSSAFRVSAAVYAHAARGAKILSSWPPPP